MLEKLFVYGTLQDPDVQKEVINRIVPGKKDTLLGYRLDTVVINNKTYPIAQQDKQSEIAGVVIRISSKELSKLDVYETSAYRRVRCILESGIEAWVYIKPLKN